MPFGPGGELMEERQPIQNVQYSQLGKIYE
jgi:hypothetical protein